MSDDIINILELNDSDVQSCTSKFENNSLTYFITLVRKNIICPHCQHKLIIKDYYNTSIKHEIILGINTIIIYRKRRYQEY